MNILEKMKQDWNRRAKHDAKFWIATEDFRSDAMFDESGQKDALRLLQGMEGYPLASWHVLEIGCGIGRLVKPLSSRFAYLCGVDVSGEMIQQSKRWLSGIANVETFENNGVDLSLFENNRFDLVYSYVAFQHMPKEVFKNYLKEINRVLKPSGFLKFEIKIGNVHTPSFEDTISLRIYQEDELGAWLDQAGFGFPEKRLIDHGIENVFKTWFILVQKAGECQPDQEEGWLRNDCQDQIGAGEKKMLLLLAGKYLEKNERKMAVETLKQLRNSNPDFVEESLGLADSLVREKKIDEAISFLNDVLKLNPSSVKVRVGLLKLNRLREPEARPNDFARLKT